MTERWRVGRHQPRNIYFDDREVAVAVGGDVEAEAVAALMVGALNALAENGARPAVVKTATPDCVFCGERIFWAAPHWRHSGRGLASCSNGTTNASPG